MKTLNLLRGGAPSRIIRFSMGSLVRRNAVNLITFYRPILSYIFYKEMFSGDFESIAEIILAVSLIMIDYDSIILYSIVHLEDGYCFLST